MPKKELKAVLAMINKVLPDPRLEPGQRDQLCKAKQIFMRLGQRGKIKRSEVFRAAQIVATTLNEVLEAETERRPE